MPSIITSHLEDIAAICRANGIRRLFVFGSAAQDTFDPESSDLDFQVDLGEYDSSVGRRYRRFVTELHLFFGRDVDVITSRSRGNPRFLAEVERTRKLIYEA